MSKVGIDRLVTAGSRAYLPPLHGDFVRCLRLKTTQAWLAAMYVTGSTRRRFLHPL